MKRWLCLLALLMLLTGCTAEGSQREETGPEGAPGDQSAGLYDPENAVETNTAGAVKAYDLNGAGFYGIVSMGEDHLLFGENSLTLLTGDHLVPAAHLVWDGLPAADSGMIQVTAEEIVFYDTAEQAVIWLNKELGETSRLCLSETVTGSVYLTPDGASMYYCADGCVRVMDLKTGISRLLKEHNGACSGITGGLFDGQILRCSLTGEDGEIGTVLISGQTGQTLAQGEEFADMRLSSQWYVLMRQTEWIVGYLQEQPHTFRHCENYEYVPLPQIGAMVGIHTQLDGVAVHYYDLTTGFQSGTLWLKEFGQISDLTTDGKTVWFTCGDVLYQWVPEMSGATDPTVYTTPRYSREDPDEEGLAALQQRGDALGQQYGVQILIGQAPQGLEPWDYSFVTEYLTPPLEEGLDALEKALGQFPAGFFTTAAQWTDSGVLKILLVRGVYGSQDQEDMNSAAGIQYLLDGDAYIVLSLGEGLEQSFYHTMGHLIDTVVMSSCSVFYEWDTLNPSGFTYDNDYAANQNRDEEKYLTGSSRYFIDTYSMSFPVEDRARILEYACMPGNEEYFSSQYMQAKLQRICKGIRQAFGLKEDPTQFLWEQYLK